MSESGSDFGGDSDASSVFEPVKPKKTAPKKAVAKPKKRAVPDSDDDLDADVTLDGTPPANKRQKVTAAAGKKKAAAKSLKSKKNEADEDEDEDENRPVEDYEIQEKYKTLNLREFILQRPDTHAGSMNPTEGDKPLWVIDNEGEMQLKNFSHIPVLYKCIDEVLVNAADNKVKHSDKMTWLKVTFDRKENVISICNNGPGIPIKMDDDMDMYNPQLVFGELMASSNFDDEMKKITGGRNGVGAKIANIFSTEFSIETQDNKHRYRQTWRNNMSEFDKPKITTAKGEQYTKVTWKPDLARFKIPEMDEDFEAFVHRRVVDMSATLGTKTYWNGDLIKKPRNFKQYCEMYIKALHKLEDEAEKKMELVFSSINEYWEIGFACSNGTAQQISFVNNIATTSGGTHVDYIANQLVTKINEVVKKKNKAAKVGPAQIKNHLFLFVNAKIVNPEFDSQSKIRLVSRPANFGSKCELPEDFIKKVLKSQVVTNILESATVKADKAAKRTDGSGRRSRIHNANLTDANLAGTKNGHLCTLILTEGLSAMGLALAGISAINGRDRFGVFPLRGKVLNVRDASHDQIMKNAEITAIKQILGLQHKKEYTSTKELRYGHIMIMTDQDHDGSHIKGLLINFFETSFPSLLRIPNFLIEFITPIVKVYKGNIKKPSQAVTFFTMPEYEYWKEHVRAGSGWKHKYFKGLGTSDGEDAKVYFSDLDKHLKEFDTMDPDGRKLIELAFAKTKADERKEWLRQYVPGTYIDHTVDRIKYTEFVNKELILFSIADCARSIPSVVDGLKPGQRKIIYAAFKKNLKTELKVAQLSGYVSEHTGYLHGEASLQGTITNMAQIFVGANNVNLLEPSGNFGSRISGGKDAASARYIFTSLSPFTRKVIPEQDDRLLEYNDDDGMRIEPKWYCPVVPMILVNGADGIGTGWSTSIPSYNPEDIVANIRRLLKGEEVEPMSPWFRGWTGQMERLSEHKFKFTGTIRQIDALTVEVTELPIRMWTQQFKEKLEDIIKAEKTPSWIKDYVDYNSPTKVHFIITLNSEKDMQEALAEGLENRFKLTSTITTTNLVAFDPEGRIKRYTSVEEILEEFYLLRLRYYQMRKDRLLVDLNAELEKLSHQARFIKMVVEGKLILSNRPSKLVAQDLKKNNFPTYSKKKEAEMAGEVEPTVEEDEEVEAEGEASVSGYDYLLKMSIGTLTKEKAERLMKQVADKEHEIDELQKKSPKDLWLVDLDTFLEEWHRALEEDERREKNLPKKKAGARGAKGKGRKLNDDDSDFEVAAKKKKAPAKKNEKQTLLPFAPASPATKKTTQRNATKKPVIVDGLSDDDLDQIGRSAPVAAKPAAKPASKPPPKEELSDDDFDLLTSKPPPAKNATSKPPPIFDDDGDSYMTADDRPSVDASSSADKPAAAADDDDDSDVWLQASTTSKPAKKSSTTSKTARAAATKASKAQKDIYDFDESDAADDLGDLGGLVKSVGDESVASVRPLIKASKKSASSSATAKAPVKQAAPRKKKTVLADSEEEDSDVDEPPIKKPLAKAAAAKKAAAKPAPVAAKKKKESISITDSEDEDDDVPLVPVKKSALAKKAAPVKKKKVVDEDEMDLDSDLDTPHTKKVATKKSAPGKKAAPSKKAVISDDEDMSMGDEPKPKKAVSAAPPARAARGRTAASKKVNYKIDKDSSEEESEEVASEAESEDFDESDF